MLTDIVVQPAAPCKPDPRQQLIDNILDQMQSTRSAFEFFIEFGDLDGAESAFNTALQMVWSMLVMNDPNLALIDPTRPVVDFSGER